MKNTYLQLRNLIGQTVTAMVQTYLCLCLQKNFLNLAKLSEVHSNTESLLFEFNRLQYTLAAPEVFVAFANPLPSRCRVGIVRNTNIDR